MAKVLVIGALILSALLVVRSVTQWPIKVPDNPFVVTDDVSPLHTHMKANPQGLPPDTPRP